MVFFDRTHGSDSRSYSDTSNLPVYEADAHESRKLMSKIKTKWNLKGNCQCLLYLESYWKIL